MSSWIVGPAGLRPSASLVRAVATRMLVPPTESANGTTPRASSRGRDALTPPTRWAIDSKTDRTSGSPPTPWKTTFRVPTSRART